MQPEKIQITCKGIQYAEQFLFRRGELFDLERRDFIRNLDTVDLQAVPGSGKTTALLAKLLILEKYMPFEDGSGVLVISHTNRAVDEIKKKIGNYCPKLFSYPNYVGTVQSFVDRFLVIPCGHILLKTRLSFIDSDQFRTRLWDKFQKISWSEQFGKPGHWFWARHIHEAEKQSKGDAQVKKEICTKMMEKEVKDIFYDFNDAKIKRVSNGDNVLVKSANAKFIGLKTIIDETIYEGLISFEYAYNLAKHYINKFPQLKTFLQSRFRYVFVDEMQDMDSHQHDLLEDLFYRKRVLRHVYQRIGDKNQAIYSDESNIQNIWKRREKTLLLRGSYRLPPNIAGVVKYFGTEFCEIKGLRKDDDGKEIDIKPHLIVFDDHTINQVIPEFALIIKKLHEEGKIPDKLKYPIKAIGWRKEHEESLNLGIKDYHEAFEKNEHNPKFEYPNLKSYLLFYEKKGDKTLRYIRKNILSALLKILLLEEIQDENNSRYTTTGLTKFFNQKEGDSICEDFELIIYQWCKRIYQGKVDDVYNEIKGFVPAFLSYFDANKKVKKSKNFVENINGKLRRKEKMTNAKECSNLCIYEGVKIQIETVHAVKGETHTATLYLETYFHQDGQGEDARSYESQRLIEQLKANPLNGQEGDRVKQSARMVYVGFSRPTHLLCFAVHKDRFNQENFDNIWNIHNLSKELVR